MSTARCIWAGVPQVPILLPTLYSLYINDTPQAVGVNLALFADDTSLCDNARKAMSSENSSDTLIQCGMV
jgi:hypothetical protein